MARQDDRTGTNGIHTHGVQDARPSERIAVMDWLLAVGHVAVRKLRGRPLSPMVRLH
jgi:hypothetical protein